MFKKLSLRQIVLIAAYLIAFSAMCQNNARQRNTIYVLDCTGSMNGYNGAPDIWQPTKDFLRKELEKESSDNANSRVTILPFQDNVLQPINVDLKNINWPNLDATLNKHVAKVTATNICDSWLEAEKYIDQTCDNYIVLMTDGHDNIGGNANEQNRVQRLAQILQAFCGKYQNTKGFYVELTAAAQLPAGIQSAIDICKDLYKIEASNGIPTFGTPSDNIVHVNTRELPTDITIGFSNSGTFKAELENADNEYVRFSIKGNKISHGRIILHIESKFGENIETLNKAIAGPSADLQLQIHSDEVNITNPDLEVLLHAAPIRSLDIQTDNQGKLVSSLERIKPFLLWFKGNPADTLRWQLNPMFSEEAKSAQSSAMFRLKSNRDLSAYKVLYNGESMTDSVIIVTPDNCGVIELITPKDAEDSEFNIVLSEVSSHNLDRINGERPENAKINLAGKCSTSRSIVEIISWIILALIVLFLLLWFSLIRNKIYPKFKRGIITICSPYYATIKAKDYMKIVIGPRSKQQSLVESLWKGKILYHTNPAWPCEIEITPSGNNMRFRCPEGQLISDPTPVWTRGSEIKIISATDSSFKIEININ